MHLLSLNDLINHAVVVVDIQQSSRILNLLNGKGHIPTRTVLDGKAQNVTLLTHRDGTQVLLIGQITLEHNTSHLVVSTGQSHGTILEVDLTRNSILDMSAVVIEVQITVDQSAIGGELDSDTITDQRNDLTADLNLRDLKGKGQTIETRSAIGQTGNNVILPETTISQRHNIITDLVALRGIPHLLPSTVKHTLGILKLLTSLIVHHVGGTNMLSDGGRLDNLDLDDVLQNGAEELLNQDRELQSGDGQERSDRGRLGIGLNLGIPESIHVLDDRLDVRIIGGHSLKALNHRTKQISLVLLHQSTIRDQTVEVTLNIDTILLVITLSDVLEIFIESLGTGRLETTERTALVLVSGTLPISGRLVKPTNGISHGNISPLHLDLVWLFT